MRTKLYTALGFVTWEGFKLVVRRKLSQNRTALAAATVALVVVGGLVAARVGSSEE
jgi:hypothetical protein